MKAKHQAIQTTEKPKRTAFQEYSEALVVAVILAIIIRALLVQAFKIPSGSMEPTLLVGDHILVNKFIYGERIPFTDLRWPQFTTPKRGDVIVFTYPVDRSKDFIKRVVAVGGDTIEVRGKKVFLNGKEIHEPYAHYLNDNLIRGQPVTRIDTKAITVPKGYLFVMGDNRDQSQDSRYWGFVPVKDVKGNAFLIYYSAQHFPGRLFKLIH